MNPSPSYESPLHLKTSMYLLSDCFWAFTICSTLYLAASTCFAVPEWINGITCNTLPIIRAHAFITSLAFHGNLQFTGMWFAYAIIFSILLVVHGLEIVSWHKEGCLYKCTVNHKEILKFHCDSGCCRNYVVVGGSQLASLLLLNNIAIDVLTDVNSHISP